MNKLLLIKPVITEKSLKEVALGRFTFLVDKDATKKELTKAVEQQFKVNVVAVSTVNQKGKTSRRGKKRTEVVLPAGKKARFQLKDKQKIDLFEVTQES